MCSRLCRLGILVLIVVHLLIPQAHAQATNSLPASLEQLLAAPDQSYLHDRDPPQTLTTLRALYAKHGFAPLWQRSGKPTIQALRLAQILRDAEAYGLRPADYDADWIDTRMRELIATRNAGTSPWPEFDLRLSSAALRFARHLHYGRVDPRACGYELPAPRSDLNDLEAVDVLSSTNDTAAALAAIEPYFYHYRLLKTALAKYRTLSFDATLTDLPAFAGRSLEPGAQYSGAAPLRRLLAALGDLNSAAVAAPSDESLDDALVTALRSFQERHGLTADGVLGQRTLAALTVPLARRVRQIELTLERWRWLPAFDTPPIVVNLPEFRLFALRSTGDREADTLQMDVIVGRTFPYTRTPIFVADMKYVIFRPYWDVPDSIVRRELLPEIRSNPAYLDENHLELVNGPRDDSPVVPATPANIESLATGELRLRQQPGADNALGAIKFVLPNPYKVYLHATPAQHLFMKSSRAFSHGCIRVSDPVALAEHVLRNAEGDWTAENIELAMNGEPNQRVDLAKPIRVMILYGTVMATESGRVLFFDDIYGHDQRLEGLLEMQHE
jgi:murein L,D-transpeptidase YcbB/YkuD